jgi:predicted nucleic acid-binding protein
MVYKVFIDTNVILEQVLVREKWKDALDVFKLAEDGKIDCFCSSASYYTLCYVLKKYQSEKQVRIILRKYLTFISVLPTDEKQLYSGLASSFKDVEDAFQYILRSARLVTF